MTREEAPVYLQSKDVGKAGSGAAQKGGKGVVARPGGNKPEEVIFHKQGKSEGGASYIDGPLGEGRTALFLGNDSFSGKRAVLVGAGALAPAQKGKMGRRLSCE